MEVSVIETAREALFDLEEYLAETSGRRFTRRTAELTEREREVLSQLAAGLTTDEAAEALHVSPHTVRRHFGRLSFGTMSTKRSLGMPSFHPQWYGRCARATD